MTIVQPTSGVEINPQDDARLGGFTFVDTDEDGNGWPHYLLPTALRETPWNAVDFDEDTNTWQVSLLDVEWPLSVADAEILHTELGRLIAAARELNSRSRTLAMNRAIIARVVERAADRGWDLPALAEKAGPNIPHDDDRANLPDVQRLEDLLANSLDLTVQEAISLCRAVDLDPYLILAEPFEPGS